MLTVGGLFWPEADVCNPRLLFVLQGRSLGQCNHFILYKNSLCVPLLRFFNHIICKCFFQSYLIANHLPKEDLLDVCLYCQHYCLLSLAAEERVGQLVIWREVFPQLRVGEGGCVAPGFYKPLGRHFLLIVGLVWRLDACHKHLQIIIHSDGLISCS